MALRRSIVFATSLFAPLTGLAREAEEAGFDRVWTTEFPDRDALVRATVLGLATERIGIASGIAYSFTRHPLALAAAALDVHEATGGRFTLGLGTATAAMRSRWYGRDEGRAIGRLAETTALMRTAWASDGRFRFDGELFQGRVEGLDLAARAAALPPLAIYGSGLNAAMLRGAARCCDGLGLHPLAAAPLYAERTVAPILAAARRQRDLGTESDKLSPLVPRTRSRGACCRRRCGSSPRSTTTARRHATGPGGPWPSSSPPRATRRRPRASRGPTPPSGSGAGSPRPGPTGTP